ncbi:MAG: helix-turn-helix transcriptional regulator [Spirochaetales bacterium]|nr:helix-turn-helix transcriptional regulator [Spirochaetales bacterium]
MKDFIFFYYLLSYTVGITTLFLAFMLFLRNRNKALSRFMLVTLSFTIVIINGSLLSYFDFNESFIIKQILRFLSYLSACAYIFLLPRFVNYIYGLKSAKIINYVFLLGAILCFITMSILYLLMLSSFVHYIVMSGLLCAILYSLFCILFKFNSKAEALYIRFFQYMAIIIVILLPVMIYLDFFLLDNLLRANLRNEFPITLPLVYACWCGIFLFMQVRALLTGWMSLVEITEKFISHYRITKKEKQVIGLLLHGKSYKEIMGALDVSMSTVKTHITNIYKKTGALNKMELAQIIKKTTL